METNCPPGGTGHCNDECPFWINGKCYPPTCQGKSSPDREKIARIIDPNLDNLHPTHRREVYDKADQILALCEEEIEQTKTLLRAQAPNLIAEAKEQERERIEGIIDAFMANGEYKVVTEEGYEFRGSGADMEYVWKQIRQALEKG